MCNHLEEIYIKCCSSFYSQTCLCFPVSEQDFGHPGVVNGFICGVSVSRNFVHNTSIFCKFIVMCTNICNTSFKRPPSFYSQVDLCLAVLEQGFGCSGVGNRRVYWVSVWRLLLNDTHIFVYSLQYVQILVTRHLNDGHLNLQQNIPLFSDFKARRLGVLGW